jgi:hypothetical protein
MVYMNETITYTIQDKVNPDAGANVSMFSGATSPVGSAANPTSGYTYQWNPTIGLTNPTAPLTTISLTNTTSSNVDYVYTLTSFLDGTACEGQDTVTISVKPVVNGIEDAPFATLQLYPNPGKGGFMLESQSFQGQSVSIQLFNSIGQKVHATQDLLSDGKYEVRLVQPISGIYFVKISANSRTQIVKYIVE